MNTRKTTPTIENRKAYHDYFVLEKLECGIELKGHEIKSIRAGKCNLKDSWGYVTTGSNKNELFLSGMHITKYSYAMDIDVDEDRDKRLLAHKGEIRKLLRQTAEEGLTLVPLKVYFTNGKCKVKLGLCKGKKNYDKRNCLKEKDIKREMARHM